MDLASNFRRRARQEGAAALLLAILCAAVLAALLLAPLAAPGAATRREAASDRALAQAREALVAYAAHRPITPFVGPGYLPCPDLDDDGWAEAICGSLDGDRGQAERLGRLPWKTLGLADLRDGHGERLWYAVGTKFKGLLNCAASAACVDMSPRALRGTITVRDAGGAVTHDGTLADAQRPGAAAVILAPGPALDAGRRQQRGCAPGECDAAGRCTTDPPRRARHCDPANFLDAAAGEDNAAFHDRLDAARIGNGDGFIRGPVADGRGRLVVNDRVLAITAADLLPAVMRRVALEVEHCLDYYATRPENGGRYPAPDAACGGASASAYGRVPDTPFEATVAASAGTMLARWWRAQAAAPERLDELPTASHACRLAVPPADEGAPRRSPAGTPDEEGSTVGRGAPSWWNAWKAYVFYAPAAGVGPAAPRPGCTTSGACIEALNEEGRLLGAGRHFAVVVERTPGECLAPALACDGAACRTVRLSNGIAAPHVAIAHP